MGVPEAFDRNLGQHLYNASRDVEFLNNNDFEGRTRMIKKLEDGHQSIFHCVNR